MGLQLERSGTWVAKEVCRWAPEWLSLGVLVRASANAN